MVVLVERDNPDSDVAASRGWVIPESIFADLEATLRRSFGAPVQEGMRDLATGQDLYVTDAELRNPRSGDAEVSRA
jgi:hypothetical protein